MSEQPNHELRAFRAWEVLIKQAEKNKPITYKELAEQVGVHHRVCRFFLDYIQNYCMDEEMPPLTSIVVSREGKVGKGFIAYDVTNIGEGQKKVYNFNWHSYINPFQYAQSDGRQSELAADLLDTTKSKEVYAKVKVRGVAQSLFRKALLDVYHSKCAFCGFRIPEALEAAHIVPWSVANEEEKLDVRNGLLLCSNHHKLFDKNIYMLDENYTIKINSSYSSKLAGKTIKLPQNKQHFPEKQYIKKRLYLNKQ
ncbi:HNH endonuclease [Heyndrickxia acidicola]|uniref:HNH endonuclease n=1 Tax=Heyndrickxia acidicola TaxID=209389 RepID=A0ABU6MNM0_9BACI|nr:HNH endonuclease [Heyndrickxia acidicola]MED1206105.1 HNH endonuclease [Heyndrickxia acidicola]